MEVQYSQLYYQNLMIFFEGTLNSLGVVSECPLASLSAPVRGNLEQHKSAIFVVQVSVEFIICRLRVAWSLWPET